jgi:hypothetical protein
MRIQRLFQIGYFKVSRLGSNSYRNKVGFYRGAFDIKLVTYKISIVLRLFFIYLNDKGEHVQ